MRLTQYKSVKNITIYLKSCKMARWAIGYGPTAF